MNNILYKLLKIAQKRQAIIKKLSENKSNDIPAAQTIVLKKLTNLEQVYLLTQDQAGGASLSIRATELKQLINKLQTSTIDDIELMEIADKVDGDLSLLQSTVLGTWGKL